jgi:hypothetical protein
MERKFAHLLKRPLSLNPINNIHMNSCRIPGAGKNYICANGAIKICERIGLAPDIGTVMHGIDLNVCPSSLALFISIFRIKKPLSPGDERGFAEVWKTVNK